jgi:hypothetical protein
MKLVLKSLKIVVRFSVYIFLLLLSGTNIYSNPNDPLAAYKIDKMWHFIDYDGKEIMPPQEYENVLGYSEGAICVSKMIGGVEKWGFIDIKGNLIIQPEYDNASLFSEGYALVYKVTE